MDVLNCVIINFGIIFSGCALVWSIISIIRKTIEIFREIEEKENE
jgi:hypothetical protein